MMMIIIVIIITTIAMITIIITTIIIRIITMITINIPIVIIGRGRALRSHVATSVCEMNYPFMVSLALQSSSKTAAIQPLI